MRYAIRFNESPFGTKWGVNLEPNSFIYRLPAIDNVCSEDFSP